MTRTVTRDRAQQGRSNNTKGKAWMTDVARYLRLKGFPMDVISDNGRSDLAGLTEWAVECKNMIEDRWPEVMSQVQRDQQARGARWHVLLKKCYKKPPGQGLAVMSIEQWAEIARLLDRTEE
jgi:hypothetical protein